MEERDSRPTVKARTVHAGVRSTIMHHSGCTPRHASPRHSRCASCGKLPHDCRGVGPICFDSLVVRCHVDVLISLQQTKTSYFLQHAESELT